VRPDQSKGVLPCLKWALCGPVAILPSLSIFFPTFYSVSEYILLCPFLTRFIYFLAFHPFLKYVFRWLYIFKWCCVCPCFFVILSFVEHKNVYLLTDLLPILPEYSHAVSGCHRRRLNLALVFCVDFMLYVFLVKDACSFLSYLI